MYNMFSLVWGWRMDGTFRKVLRYWSVHNAGQGRSSRKGRNYSYPCISVTVPMMILISCSPVCEAVLERNREEDWIYFLKRLN